MTARLITGTGTGTGTSAGAGAGTGPDGTAGGVEQSLGRYWLGERIGQGGVAEVFRAELRGAEGFSKTFAIKRIRPEVASDPAVVDSFLAEAELARRLSHGSIIQIHDVGIAAELPYLVMEYVAGLSLADLLRSAGFLAVADALYVIDQVCAALDYAHQLTDEHGRSAGIVHRDVHPHNILLSRDGVVKLTDFGIATTLAGAARTLPGLIKGTFGYLSPEQVHGQPATPASDQFAAGIVLYEMLSGSNPLLGPSTLGEYRKRLAGGVPPLPVGRSRPRSPQREDTGAVDAELATIVSRAVAPDPTDRFLSIGDLRAELERWRVTRGIRVAPESVRRAVREALGLDRTAAVLRLDHALADQLDGDKVRRTQMASGEAAPPRQRRLVRLALAVLAMLAAGIAAYVLAARLVHRDDNRTAAREEDESAGQPVGGPGPSRPAVTTVTSPAMQPGTPVDGSATPVAPALTGDAGPAGRDSAASNRPGSTERDAGRDARPGRPHGKLHGNKDRVRPGAGTSSDRGSKTSLATGQVKINLLPWARVRIDGKEVGRTPLTVSLAPGSHRVELDNPGTGQQSTRTITVEANQSVTITRW